MSVKPITRMEHILAGENITPIGRKEYFVQQAVQNGGGSGETYETVAEIQVGEMEGHEGQYSYADSIETVPEISESETYYLNDKSNPSTFFDHGSDASMVGFNLKLDDGDQTRIDPSKPFVIVGFTDDVNDSLVVQSDTPDLSNTTVKILKKVSGGGDLPENVKPTYEFGFTVAAGSEAGTFVATPDTGVTYAAIAAALAETPNVYAVLNLGFSNQIIRALFSVDSTASGSESTSALALFYDGTKFQAARLLVSANGADIVIKDT